ncbi:uncharacterized protein LOC133178080 isoform X1 [Saccostrea echinata]|uniref:uncharacterized protein LOC133178080 isoform X1 n=1 Tax=Saccostrea echinata TaxID=191078 RepID=UPI002A824977|nr:uncharacterized protein LOC133178080 isoform X1 [Saccostrea echinata]
MKRRLSSEDSCTEGNIMTKKRKTKRGKKGGRKHSPRSSTDSSKVPRTPRSCVSDTNTSCHNSESVGKLSVAEEYALISQEICDSETVCLVSQTDLCAENSLDISEVTGDTNVTEELQQVFQSCYDATSESNNDACILSQTDILGLLQGLSNTYNLAEVPLQEQPFHVVSDGSSMYLVGPQNQIYMSLVPPAGRTATTDSHMVCTVHENPDHSNQHTDNTKYSYYATMDVDRREAHLLKYPSHLLEWSERVKFRHERKWKMLDFHEPHYSEWDFV